MSTLIRIAGGTPGAWPAPWRQTFALLRLRRLNAHAVSAVMVALALGAAMCLPPVTVTAVAALVLLVPVWASALVYGLRPSLAAGLEATLAYDFFFLPPLYTFAIAGWPHALALIIFASVAAGGSLLAARVREAAIEARRREMLAGRLLRFSRKMAAAGGRNAVAASTASHLGVMMGAGAVVLLGDGAALTVAASHPPGERLGESEMAAAMWCWRYNRPAGRGTSALPGVKRLFVPIATADGVAGVISLGQAGKRRWQARDQGRIIELIAGQAAVALERVRLAQEVEEARLAAETERLRAALLTSISHDLKTPLASILGSVTSLKSCGHLLEEAAREELLDEIQEEAERLHRFIGNLLDMTRLESAAIRPRREFADMSDIAGSALRRAARLLAAHKVAVDIPAGLPMLELDPVLMEQVLFNLLDNGAKYTPEGTQLMLCARCEGGQMVIQVADEGCGIPAKDIGHLFEKFYRAQPAESHPVGTGLGLAICRGFVEAMGGTITAANRADRPGAVFTITMPAPSGGRENCLIHFASNDEAMS